MERRAIVISALLVVAAASLGWTTSAEILPEATPLVAFPMQIGSWSGKPAPDFNAELLTELGVDDYLNRMYTRTGDDIVGLYVGYYQSQRQGDTIHSPMNCLPGAGWTPVKAGRIALAVSGNKGPAQPIEVNRYVIEKSLERQLVLYWYQSHSRVIASEYLGRIHMVLDAIRLNRTDGALVRVISPIPEGEDAERLAERRAIEFVTEIFPLLARYLPA